MRYQKIQTSFQAKVKDKVLSYDYSLEGSFVIPKEHKDAALKALFESTIINPPERKTDNLKDFFKVWDDNWRHHYDQSGNFVLDAFDFGRNRFNYEMLSLLAPFAREDSELDGQGEDGEQWRYAVKNGKLIEVGALLFFGYEDVIQNLINKYGDDITLKDIKSSMLYQEATNS